MSAYITHHIRISNGTATKDGVPVSEGINTPEELYWERGCNYPKFFKMDLLCKWAWLATEILLTDGDARLYDGLDKNNVAVVLATGQGCIDVDKKYLESVATIPSPALFVYTLPNIMLGEICIRHGFKGEQACVVNEGFDSGELYFWANDLLEKRGMDAALCGWVNVGNGQQDIYLFWLSKSGDGTVLSPAAMQHIYGSQP